MDNREIIDVELRFIVNVETGAQTLQSRNVYPRSGWLPTHSDWRDVPVIKIDKDGSVITKEE